MLPSNDDPIRGPQTHVDDHLLAAFAMGEADDLADLPAIEIAEVRAHLDSCELCSAELEAMRETFSFTSFDDDLVLAPPPPRVWEAIAAQIASEPQEQPAPDPQSPDSAVHATVTDLARRRGVPTWFATTAAAVTLALGLGAGWLIAGESDEPTPQPQATVVSTAQLASLDEAAEQRGRAEVRRVDDRVALHVEAQRLGGPNGIREVWLINVDGSRMVSLGLLDDGEAGDFDFPSRLLDEGYRIVDISYEPGDGDPTHSGKSLARGTLSG